MSRLTVVLLLVVSAAGSLCAQPEPMDVDVLAAWVRNVVGMEHYNERFERKMFLEQCGGDSNRFARVGKRMCELYPKEEAAVAFGLRLIGGYGTTNDLPYLERYVTNELVGADAARSIERIGFNEYALEQLRRYHSVTNVALDLSYFLSRKNCLLENILIDVSRMNPRPSAWTNLFEYSYNYISNNVKSVDRVDRRMLELRPEYRFTKRRLALMRWVLQNTEHPFYRAETQKVIDEMVAYPEANLPE